MVGPMFPVEWGKFWQTANQEQGSNVEPYISAERGRMP